MSYYHLGVAWTNDRKSAVDTSSLLFLRRTVLRKILSGLSKDPHRTEPCWHSSEQYTQGLGLFLHLFLVHFFGSPLQFFGISTTCMPIFWSYPHFWRKLKLSIIFSFLHSNSPGTMPSLIVKLDWSCTFDKVVGSYELSLGLPISGI